MRIHRSPIRLWFFLGLFMVWLGWSYTAVAAESGPPSGHIYLDTHTGRFNAALRKDAGDSIPIYTRAPTNARIELIYWSIRRGELCPAGEEDNDDYPDLTDAQLSRATVRSFAPQGTATTGNEYYVTNLGPLLYGVEYCFYIRGLIPRMIEAGDQGQISTALRKTVEGAWERQLVGSFPPACESLDPTSKRLCELREHFASELPQHLTKLKVILPGETEPIALPTAFERIVRRNETLFALFDDALAQTAAWNGEKDIFGAWLRLLKGDENNPALPAFVFDPVEGLTRADLKGFATSDEAKKLIEAAGDDSPELLKALFLEKVYKDFKKEKPWAVSGGNAQRQAKKKLLMHVFVVANGQMRSRNDPPPYLNFDEDLRSKLVAAIQAVMMVKGNVKPVQDLSKVFATIRRTRGFPTYDAHPNKADLDTLRGLAEGVVNGTTRLVAARKAFGANFDAKKGAPSPVVATLMKNVSAVRRLETSNRFAFDPDYQQRFPLYASGDAGIAIGGIFVRGERAPRADIAAYFGLNLYFTAVDKDEPLREVYSPGRNFLRRFSIVGGISFIHPEINRADLRLDGVLLKQTALTGVGLRVTDYLRLGAGAMYFTHRSPNPISDRKRLKLAPYLSVSIDVDVIGRIRGWRDTARGGQANPSV